MPGFPAFVDPSSPSSLVVPGRRTRPASGLTPARPAWSGSSPGTASALGRGARRADRRQRHPADRRPVLRLERLDDPDRVLARERGRRRLQRPEDGRTPRARPRRRRRASTDTGQRRARPISTSKACLMPFFGLHYGIFWLVHGVFVLTLPAFGAISGERRARGRRPSGTVLLAVAAPSPSATASRSGATSSAAASTATRPRRPRCSGPTAGSWSST